MTLNTLLAFLTSLARLAFMVPIVEGLGQLKWIWFSSHKHRPLVDFQLFDDAAQGGVGGLKLLFGFKGYYYQSTRLSLVCGADLVGKSFRASLGALIMLSGLFTSTLTQQAISYTVIQAVSNNNGTALVNRATTFSTYDGHGLAISKPTNYPYPIRVSPW